MIETEKTGRVARFTLNRPDKRNALNIETCRQLLAALDQAEGDPGVGAILLCGNGPAFCAGMDLAEVLSADQEALVDIHEPLFTFIDRIRKPVIAAVQGAAMAGGMGIAANAHIIVAAPDAKFSLTEVRIGLWPVIVYRSIARAIGERRAMELSMTGRVIGPEEARLFGLVTEISEDPRARGLEIAKQISGFSPIAMAAGFEDVIGTRSLDWASAAPVSRKVRSELMGSPDFAEGVKAFLEKRRPEWPSLKQ